MNWAKPYCASGVPNSRTGTSAQVADNPRAMGGAPPRFDKAGKRERTVSHYRQLHAGPAKTGETAPRPCSTNAASF